MHPPSERKTEENQAPCRDPHLTFERDDTAAAAFHRQTRCRPSIGAPSDDDGVLKSRRAEARGRLLRASTRLTQNKKSIRFPKPRLLSQRLGVELIERHQNDARHMDGRVFRWRPHIEQGAPCGGAFLTGLVGRNHRRLYIRKVMRAFVVS
jgi:hypothetical protein